MQYIVANNPNRIINPSSKAASTQEQQQYQTVVTAYDMGGSSTGELVYKCGTHNFETKSLNEFNSHVTSHNDASVGCKAASLPSEPEPEKPIIEGIPHYTVNKVKEIHDFMVSNGSVSSSSLGPKGWKEERQANGSVVYTNPNPASKAASVPSINKAKEIYDFITSDGNI